MERESLGQLVAEGVSVEKIAQRFGRDPSTVSYWMRKYGLVSSHREKHAARGGLEREVLERLVERGLSLSKMAEELHRSPATVRHWLKRHGLETLGAAKRRRQTERIELGDARAEGDCPIHGRTMFWQESRGYLRCLQCRQEAVTRRRRKVKELLVKEAGGACRVCGYSRYLGALQFHHIDPGEKSFSLSMLGLGRSLDKARLEAQKCVLLCSNCHAEVEAGLARPPG